MVAHHAASRKSSRMDPASVDRRLPFHIRDQPPDELNIVDSASCHPSMATTCVPTAEATGFHCVGDRQDKAPIVCYLLHPCGSNHPRCVHPGTMQQQHQWSGGAGMLSLGWQIEQVVSRKPFHLQLAIDPLSTPKRQWDRKVGSERAGEDDENGVISSHAPTLLCCCRSIHCIPPKTMRSSHSRSPNLMECAC